MQIVDANVLLYAVHERSRQHEQARSWLTQALAGAAPVGLSWLPLLAFVRLTTKPGLFARPLDVTTAMDLVEGWLGAPAAHLVEPTARHASVLAGLLEATGTGGNLTNDAHLAALAIEHRGTVVSYDADFGRFPGVRWQRPGG